MIVLKIVIVLAILILVHEFGHFIVAKKSGIRVDEFGLGLPPRAWGKRFGETLYSLNWIPFGGFVKIFGEDPSEEDIKTGDKERSFYYKPKYVQASVIVAGIVFNFLFAVLIMWFGFFAIGMPAVVDDFPNAKVSNEKVVIASVLSDAPAGEAGISIGSSIRSISGNSGFIEPTSADEAADFIEANHGGDITLTILTGSEETEHILTPRLLSYVDEDGGVIEQKAIGVTMILIGDIKLPVHEALFVGASQTWNLTKLTSGAIYDLITGAFKGTADLDSVSGPVGIAKIVDNASEEGFGSLLFIVAIISLSLAVINLVPFPALDGGRLLFIIIESIKGSPISNRVANGFNAVGFVLLIILMIFITYRDIVKLF